MSMFNRKKSPNNCEELMISEYFRLREDNTTLIAELSDIKDTNNNLYEYIRDLKRTIEDKQKEYEKHLNEVKEQSTGIIDLHEPVEVFYIEVSSIYRFKDMYDLPTAEHIEQLRKLLRFTDSKLLKYCKEYKSAYNTRLCMLTKHTIRYVLLDAKLDKKYYFDPNINSRTMLNVHEDPTEDAYSLATEERCQVYICMIIRQRISAAIDQLSKELKNGDD